MRTPRLLRLAAALLGLAVGAAGLDACFKLDQPTCSLACGPDQVCPDDYECRQDGYCHLQGSTEACEFSDASITTDLTVVLPPDLTSAPNTDASDTDAAADL